MERDMSRDSMKFQAGRGKKTGDANRLRFAQKSVEERSWIWPFISYRRAPAGLCDGSGAQR